MRILTNGDVDKLLTNLPINEDTKLIFDNVLRKTNVLCLCEVTTMGDLFKYKISAFNELPEKKDYSYLADKFKLISPRNHWFSDNNFWFKFNSLRNRLEVFSEQLYAGNEYKIINEEEPRVSFTMFV